MFLRLMSSKGQGLLGAILVSAGIAVIGGYILNQSQQTEIGLRIPRIRSMMAGKEAQIRLLLNQSSSFDCPTGSSSCTLSPLVQQFLAEEEIVSGARCSSGASACGIKIQNPLLVGSKFTADITYRGMETQLMKVSLNLNVPLEALQAAQFECPAATPRFVGFNADGTLNCKALPANCGPGQYVVKVDPRTLALTCRDLVSSLSCNSTEYISDIKWSGGSTQVTCAPRKDPFTYFSFVPVVTMTDLPAGTPSVPPADTCVAVTTTTTIPTTTTTTSTTTTTTTSTTTTLVAPTCSTGKYLSGGICVNCTNKPANATVVQYAFSSGLTTNTCPIEKVSGCAAGYRPNAGPASGTATSCVAFGGKCYSYTNNSGISTGTYTSVSAVCSAYGLTQGQRINVGGVFESNPCGAGFSPTITLDVYCVP